MILLVAGFGALILAAAVVIAVIMFHAWKEEREWEVEFARRAEEARREVRRSLAAQLQETIYPRIYRIRLMLGDSNPEAASVFDRLAAKLRNLTSDDRVLKLPGDDLRAALSDLASPAPGGAVLVHLEDGVTVKGEAAFHLHRVAKEAIQNARKHARAETIRVELVRERGVTVLRVEDDGPIPFGTAGNMHEGFGLRSMRKRLRELGGTFHIGPGRDGRGTMIEAVFSEA